MAKKKEKKITIGEKFNKITEWINQYIGIPFCST